jgi:hypothetical protein
MANHSRVHLKRKITVEEAERLLRKTVNAVLGPTVVVESYEPELGTDPGRRSWHVFIPGSEQNEDAAWRLMKAPEDPFGFLVWFHPKGCWEFRHPSNNWEWWAQDKIQHEIARALDVKTYQDDGSGKPQKVDPEARKSTYRQYITRNFKEPLSAEDQEWIDSLMNRAPEGFRE